MRKIYRAAARRRGSQIAEASLVYPVIIVVSVMSVAAMAHFYSCAAKAAAMSIDVRSTADENACSVKRAGDIYDAVRQGYSAPEEKDGYYDAAYGGTSRGSYSIEEENGLLYGKVRASYIAEYSMSGMFSVSRRDIYTVERAAVNEAKLIWKKQLAGDILGSMTGGGGA